MSRTRLAKILANDLHPLSRPTKIDSAINKSILELGALLVVLDLRHRRLANVDVGQLRTARRRQPFVRNCRDRQHHVAPLERLAAIRLTMSATTEGVDSAPTLPEPALPLAHFLTARSTSLEEIGDERAVS